MSSNSLSKKDIHKLIINNWCKTFSIFIPNELLELICKYYLKYFTKWSTTYKSKTITTPYKNNPLLCSFSKHDKSIRCG